MIKLISLGLCVMFSFCSNAIAQSNGILPFTGIQYFNEGLNARYAEVSIDGSTLLSNRIPANKEFILKVQLPSGFTEDAAKKVFPGVEITVLSAKRLALATLPNPLKDMEKTGFAVNSFKDLPLKLNLQSQWLKNESECIVQIRLYDLKSKKQMRLLFAVSIASPSEPLAISKLSTYIKTSDESMGLSNALKMNVATIMVDTSIRVAPTNAYLSIDIPGITGTNMNEVLSGKNTFWVYDKNLNEVKITDKLLKKVGGSMEDNLVNLTVKIPYRLKTNLSKGYTIRFRWESTDRKKIIDIVSTR
jgi:hypothetical protein